jgi:branched-chain amino acid transport system permease protein
MITAFFLFIGTGMLGFPLTLSTIFAIPLTCIIGLGCYKLLFDRIKGHETAVTIISIALAMALQETLQLIFGAHYRGVSPFIRGYVEIIGIRVLYQHFFTIGVSIATLIGVWILLSKTKLGNAINAVAQDSEIANIMGINVSRICMITMGISVVLAGIAGAVVAPVLTVHPRMWISPLVIVLAVVVLGGLGSIKGSIVAAFILGFAETAVIFLIPKGAFLRGAVSLSIMIAVLLMRPEGLFGVAFEEERL